MPMVEESLEAPRVVCQFVDEGGAQQGATMLVPVTASPSELNALLRHIVGVDEDTPHAFFIDGTPVLSNLQSVLHEQQIELHVQKQLKEGRRVRRDGEVPSFEVPHETIVEVQYKQQAGFRVRPVTRCVSELTGHSEAILVCCFSPDGRVLATGGGDGDVRIWDVETTTPTEILRGHRSWVQALSWSADGVFLASGSRDGTIRFWSHSNYEKFSSKSITAHSNYITAMAWEPLHAQGNMSRAVTVSKDTVGKVWHSSGGLDFVLTGHSAGITSVRWGATGSIYTASMDRTVIVWSATDGRVLTTLRGHAHWVNGVALNTDVLVRTGSFDHEERKFASKAEACEYARSRVATVLKRCGGEHCASCSDDYTLYLWKLGEASNSAPKRLTGHQGVIFGMSFSPDGTMLASCSADKSVRLWNGITGAFITTFRGHVAAVYHVTWSLDSRMLVSGSRDSTLKLWSATKRSLVEDLSGHRDEIFSTDWSPDGQRVATGSKDKSVRIWVH